MYFFHLFRSLLPLRNPIGFGASDFTIFAITVALVAAVLLWPVIQATAQRLTQNTAWSMAMLGTLPVILRLLLLTQSPVPPPRSSNEFSLLLLGDTLAHLRLANPAHPMHRFFETVWVLQQPACSSIYPLGQGLSLAIGQVLFGIPWVGTLLSTAVFSALCYWTMRVWVRPEWAFFAGLLAVFEFGPLSYWTNAYSPAALSGSAGCLVFGSIVRLCGSGRIRYAVLLGLGISLEILIDPLQAVFLFVCAAAFAACSLRGYFAWGKLLRATPLIAALILPGIGFTLLQNKAVTHDWMTSAMKLSRFEYGVPATLLPQSNPVPHRTLTPDQDLDYRFETELHGSALTLKRFVILLASRLRFYRLFLLAPLYVGMIAFLFFAHSFRQWWAVIAVSIFVLGSNLHPFFDAQYLAAGAVLFLIASVAGLEAISDRARIRPWAQIAVLLCCAHFLFWYGVYLCAGADIAPVLAQYEERNYVNVGENGRAAIVNELAVENGKHLVFVRYNQPHPFDNWIYNAAEIDNSPIVWARDLGAAEDDELRAYYPNRTAWLVQPDAKPPKLTPYTSGSSPFEAVP